MKSLAASNSLKRRFTASDPPFLKIYSKTDCAIACRGTEPSEMNDIYADLEIFKADSVSGNKIHQGFKEHEDRTCQLNP